MSRINTGGVIKGGLVAGLIINISQTILNVPVLGPSTDIPVQRQAGVGPEVGLAGPIALSGHRHGLLIQIEVIEVDAGQFADPQTAVDQ